MYNYKNKSFVIFVIILNLTFFAPINAQNEVSKINATIKSNEELYKKYVKNKIDIVFYN